MPAIRAADLAAQGRPLATVAGSPREPDAIVARRSSGPAGLALAALLLAPCVGAQEAAPAPPPIQDNSFLIEEAYNQERGVVQHIGTFQHSFFFVYA